MSYRQKYIKYKSKYLQAKKIHGGMVANVEEEEHELCYPPDTDYNDFFLNGYNYYIVIRFGFITTIRTKIDNKEDIINYHKKNVNVLTGNFGIMSVIDHNFLKNLQEKYNLLNLINVIKNRNLRIILERFMHTLCKKYLLDNNKKLKKSLFGHYQLLENNTNPYLHKKLYGR